ncbi:hypothetical protein Bca52824_037445 [Brassica carinata]|uniref:Uncharacterized protein n=1 Tax=Brassica carinata TaxID=52824 RepID=A0A8X7S783_BRACI|nr:hypothetical protein Bca52824_037445 [Brassica carinata]
MKTSITLAIFLTLSLIGAQAKVPVDEQFRVVNEGDYTDYSPIEYNADVRGFQPFNDNFRLAYNTTPKRIHSSSRIGSEPRINSPMGLGSKQRLSVKGIALTFGEDGNLVLAEADGAWCGKRTRLTKAAFVCHTRDHRPGEY